MKYSAWEYGKLAERHAVQVERAREALRAPREEVLPEGYLPRRRTFAEDCPPSVAYRDKKRVPRTEHLDRPARQAAWARAAQRGCRKSAGLLLQDVDGLVWREVRKWAAGTGIFAVETIEDMHASVLMCLLEKAIPKFDARRASWVTYSWTWIRQACSRWTSNYARTVRLPVHLLDQRARVRREERRLSRRLGRAPTDAEVCRSTDISQDHLEHLRSFRDSALSLDASYDAEGKTTWLDMLVDEDAGNAEDRVLGETQSRVLWDAVSKLSHMERFVIEQRFRSERTLKEIGDALGLSRERVRQVEERALTRLRGAFGGR